VQGPLPLAPRDAERAAVDLHVPGHDKNPLRAAAEA
jgi:hypothetical protein